MNILEVAGSGSIGTTNMGPVSTDIYRLSRCFVELGHNVTIADARTKAKRTYLLNDIKLIETDSIPRVKLVPRLPTPKNLISKLCLRSWISCSQWINEYRFVKSIAEEVGFDTFDVIHTHEPRPTLLIQKLYKKQCIYTSHSSTWCREQFSKNYKTKITYFTKKIQLIFQFHEINAIKNAQLTVALGSYLKKYLKGAKIFVIPNGITLQNWNPIDKHEARKLVGFNKEDFILIFVGRIYPLKGVHVLLDAVPIIMKEVQRLKVIIVGSLSGLFGQEKRISAYSRKLIRDSQGLPIEFKGFIKNQSFDFQCLLSAADIFVLPSFFESQGKVILEAMAMGKPIVASNVGGIPEMVKSNVGLLFKPGEIFELARKIIYLNKNREIMEFMGKNARDHVIKNFSWEFIAKKYIDAFKSIKY